MNALVTLAETRARLFSFSFLLSKEEEKKSTSQAILIASFDTCNVILVIANRMIYQMNETKSQHDLDAISCSSFFNIDRWHMNLRRASRKQLT